MSMPFAPHQPHQPHQPHRAPNTANRRQVLTAGLPGLAAALMAAAASAADTSLDLRFAALGLGDTDEVVRRVMQTEPKETRRSTVAGIEKTVLVFEIDRNRYDITLIAGRLVAKAVETKASAWKLF